MPADLWSHSFSEMGGGYRFLLKRQFTKDCRAEEALFLTKNYKAQGFGTLGDGPVHFWKKSGLCS